MIDVVYFSNVSNFTHRFIQKLNLDSEAMRIPIRPTEPGLLVSKPYILITPTYGNRNLTNFVPRQVIKFLNVEQNRNLLKGVIAGGNMNFGADYGKSADDVSKKIGVPVLYKFEIMGTPSEVEDVNEIIKNFKI